MPRFTDKNVHEDTNPKNCTGIVLTMRFAILTVKLLINAGSHTVVGLPAIHWLSHSYPKTSCQHRYR